MSKAKIKEKVYLIGRVKELITLNKEEKVLSPTEISEITPEIILRIIIKEHIFKAIHNRILQQERIWIYIIIMLKIMNQQNL